MRAARNRNGSALGRAYIAARNQRAAEIERVMTEHMRRMRRAFVGLRVGEIGVVAEMTEPEAGQEAAET